MLTTFFEILANEQPLVLTVNSRLSRYLHESFNEHQRTQDKLVWETPTILPLQSWIEQQFHQANHQNALLLSAFQEDCLWHQIVTESKLDLLQTNQMSKLVKQAYDILLGWELSETALEPFTDQKEMCFLIDWIRTFENRCREKNWITQTQLPKHLITQSMTLHLPDKIILTGFDEFNPNIQSLFSLLKKRCAIENITLSTTPVEKNQLILENTDAEIDAAAQWLKMQWKKNPNQQFGCVILELEKMRTRVLRIFSRHFSPDQLNLSAGMMLYQHNMIQTALTLLQWIHKPLPIGTISGLLQSPYLCLTESEKNRGAQLDAQLRDQNRITATLPDLFVAATALKSKDDSCTLLSRLQAFFHHNKKEKLTPRTPSQWTQHFLDGLLLLQWPGNHTQNSAEFQILERFKKVMLSFSQSDFLFEKIDCYRALSLLTTLTQQTLFQPKSNHEPIQIMGALEASGILFDSLWVVGLHNGVWPTPAKPHPLIPYTIQQQHQMPHATAKRELQFAQHVTQRLENAAKYVIFSSPEREGDQHYFPSQLIQNIPLISRDTLLPKTDLIDSTIDSIQMETFDDTTAPPVIHFSAIEGGSNIIQYQSDCAFRAFASIRLKAKAVHQPKMGISPAIKGTLLHDMLHHFYDDIPDRQTLCNLSDDEINTRINSVIENSLSKIKHATHNTYFLTLEKKRLHTLMTSWITFEKNRPDFRVMQRETASMMQINQLPISIRLDRVDQLQDGSLLLIDYKTGAQKYDPKHWLQERLTNLQLPLYAAFQEQAASAFSAIAIAKIHTKNITFTGLLSESHLYAEQKVEGLKPINQLKQDVAQSWQMALDFWKNHLEKIADDFCQGVAITNPASADICKRCDFKSICRFEYAR